MPYQLYKMIKCECCSCCFVLKFPKKSINVGLRFTQILFFLFVQVFEAMCTPCSLRLTKVIIVCYFMMGPYHCFASQKKTTCYVQDGRADCSHLSLSAIPPNLPRNITSLDMSHNRLGGIPPESLNPYRGLLHLNVSYNSITKLDEHLCQTLPLLQTLNIEHNEVHLLKKEDLSSCTSFIRLNMASNRLKLQGEPFSALKVKVSIALMSSTSLLGIQLFDVPVMHYI